MTPSQARVDRDADMVRVRELVRTSSRQIGLGLVDETKIVTAASELARNILRYGGPAGGAVTVEEVEREGKRGLCVRFSDQGPGIGDLTQALSDGFSTGGGLGLGLPGAKRLVDDFDIATAPGAGTRITIIKWLR